MSDVVNNLMVMPAIDLKRLKGKKLGEMDVLKAQDKTDAVVSEILTLDKQLEVIDLYLAKRKIT